MAKEHDKRTLEVPTMVTRPGTGPPRYSRPGDGGADLFACEPVTIARAGGRVLVPTGICVAIPEGFCAMVLPRSGLALNHGITCLNSPGLIDSGYRGEIGVILINHDQASDFQVNPGDRIAQLVILRIENADFIIAESLPESLRGSGGFGHTGRA